MCPYQLIYQIKFLKIFSLYPPHSTNQNSFWEVSIPWVFQKCLRLSFIWILGGGVYTGSTRHCGHFWPIVPAPGDCEDGEVGGMNGSVRGNRSTRRKPVPDATLSTTNRTCQTRARTRAAAVGSQRLTASVMTRPSPSFYLTRKFITIKRIGHRYYLEWHKFSPHSPTPFSSDPS
jgi:hypothetical protein